MDDSRIYQHAELPLMRWSVFAGVAAGLFVGLPRTAESAEALGVAIGTLGVPFVAGAAVYVALEVTAHLRQWLGSRRQEEAP